MSVLWLMPNWGAASELWMQRMIRLVQPHVAAICAPSAPNGLWDECVPTRSLVPSYSRWNRIGLRLGLLPRRTSDDVLRDILDELKPTAILTHFLNFAVSHEAVLLGSGAKLFVHTHGYDVSWDAREAAAPQTKVFPSSYMEAALRFAKRSTIIANSEHTRGQLLAAGIPAAQIVVKYLGAPVSAPRADRPAVASVTILYLARLIDCKGPDLTIRAFELACERGLDGTLIVAGDGELRAACELLRARSRYADRIKLVGAVDEGVGAKLRQEADIFAAHNCVGPVTGRVEALGVSILEAMGDGLPVVTGRSGGVVETIEDGVTGILVEPGDIGAQAEAFLALARDSGRRMAMGEAGRRRVEDHFSLDHERKALEKILGLRSAPITVN